MTERGILESVADMLPVGASQAAVAGVAGGIVHWFINRKNFREGLVAMVVGSITAVYVGPFASPILGFPVVLVNKLTDGSADPVLFGAFLCGLSGISITALLADLIEKRKQALKDGAPLVSPSTDEEAGHDNP